MNNYTLYKVSDPGWSKHFSDLSSLKDELEGWICSMCWYNPDDPEQLQNWVFDGDTDELVLSDTPLTPEDAGLIDPTHYAGLSVSDKISELLWSPCGCEFMICEKTQEVIDNE